MTPYLRLVVGAALSLLFGVTCAAQRAPSRTPPPRGAQGRWIAPKDIYCPPERERGSICPAGRSRGGGARGCTPLMQAAESGNSNQVRALIRRGADVNATLPGWRHTALMLAAGKGHLEVVRALLAAGADPNAMAFGHGGVPGWAVQFAMNRCNEHWLEITQAMLDAGANAGIALALSVDRPDVPIMFKELLRRRGDANWTDAETGMTLLMMAAKYSTPEVVAALLEVGADLGRRDRDGKTVLSVAEEEKDNPWRDRIVALLMRAGAQR